MWTFGDIALSSGSSGRYSVQTVTSDHGVVSSLVLSETLAQDFQLRYNCTAWNRFGTGTALVTLREQGKVPTERPHNPQPAVTEAHLLVSSYLCYNYNLQLIFNWSSARPLWLHTETLG